MKFKTQIKYLTLAMVFGLSLALSISSCSKKGSSFTPPSTTSLSESIDSAQWYLTNTHEGTQPGEYTKGSQATLQTALTAAQAVLTASATTGTQAEVTAATANLNAAIAATKGQMQALPARARTIALLCRVLVSGKDGAPHGMTDRRRADGLT